MNYSACVKYYNKDIGCFEVWYTSGTWDEILSNIRDCVKYWDEYEYGFIHATIDENGVEKFYNYSE